MKGQLSHNRYPWKKLSLTKNLQMNASMSLINYFTNLFCRKSLRSNYMLQFLDYLLNCGIIFCPLQRVRSFDTNANEW